MTHSYNSIILSGLPASGKSTLAKRLSHILDWPIYSIGDQWRERYSKLYPSQEITFEEYWRTTNHEDNLEVNRQAREVIARGSVIADSRFSAVYCQDLPALRVFVTADVQVRAARSRGNTRYVDQTIEHITSTLVAREQDELRMGHELFSSEHGRFDYRDPTHYHLVLNSGLLRLDQEVALMKQLLGAGAPTPALR